MCKQLLQGQNFELEWKVISELVLSWSNHIGRDIKYIFTFSIKKNYVFFQTGAGRCFATESPLLLIIVILIGINLVLKEIFRCENILLKKILLKWLKTLLSSSKHIMNHRQTPSDYKPIYKMILAVAVMYKYFWYSYP